MGPFAVINGINISTECNHGRNGVGAVDADSWKEDFGISDDFVRDVGLMVQPGDSAVFALLRTVNREAVANEFSGYGGTILSTTLSSEQQAKVERVLHAA